MYICMCMYLYTKRPKLIPISVLGTKYLIYDRNIQVHGTRIMLIVEAPALYPVPFGLVSSAT